MGDVGEGPSQAAAQGLFVPSRWLCLAPAGISCPAAAGRALQHHQVGAGGLKFTQAQLP